MAKLRTIDAICTSVQSIKKYVDKTIPEYDTKTISKRIISNESLHPNSDEWYLYYEVDSFGFEIGNEYAVNVTADGVTYHGKFIAQDLQDGRVGAINFIEDGMQDIFFEEFTDTNMDMPRCLGYFQILDNLDYDYNYNDDMAVVYISLGEHEDGTPEVINNIEIDSTVTQTVPLSTELLKTHKLITDEEKNKLLTKTEGIIYYAQDIRVGDLTNPGINIEDVVYREESQKYVQKFNYNFGILYAHVYKATVLLSNWKTVDVYSDEVWDDYRPTAFFTFTNPLTGNEVSFAFRDKSSPDSLVAFDEAYFEINDISEIQWINIVCVKQQLTTQYIEETGLKFTTSEEKEKWSNKQDKIIYRSNETTIISLRNKVPLDGTLFILDYPLGLVDGEQYSAKIKFAEGIFELEESSLFSFLGLERVTDLNYEIKNNYMIFTDKFVAYSENGVIFLEVGDEGAGFFIAVDRVGMNLETGEQYLTNDSSALLCLEEFIKLVDYVEIVGPRQYEISENFFNTHELVSTFTQDDFDEMVGDIFGDQYKSKAFFTFIDSDAAPKEYKYPYIEEPYYAKELICNIYHDDGTVTTTPFWMMGGEDPGSNYSYVASVSPDNGGVSVMINNVNDKNEWRIVLDYDLSSYFVMPEGISKIEVVVIP